MKFAIIFAGLIALGSPALADGVLGDKPTIHRAADGYAFQKPQYVKPDIKIHFVFYKTEKELETAYLSFAHQKAKSKVLAFSVLGPDVCTVHTMDPQVKYAPEYIGHEVLHCSMGNWHPGFDR